MTQSNHGHADERDASGAGVQAYRARYHEYLHSEEWATLRARILTRDGHVCTRCGDKASQVHHLTYERVFEEMDEDLTSLCRACHEREHGIGGPRTVANLLASSIARSEIGEPGFTTGHSGLDSLTGGIAPGSVWVVGAETSWGKSSWAIEVADVNSRTGALPLLVSLEDPPTLYGERLMCMKALVSADSMRRKDFSKNDLIKMHAITSGATSDPMFMDSMGMCAAELAEHIANAIDDNGHRIVIIDYVQELHLSTGRFGSRRDELNEAVRLLKSKTRRRGCALILLSQVTSDAEHPGYWPSKEQIRDSRDLINAADVVVMGATVSKRMPRMPFPDGSKCFKVEKAKNGRKGIVQLCWDDRCACFLNHRRLGSHDCWDDLESEPWQQAGVEQWD